MAAAGDGPRLILPLACDYGETCFIQNYVDHDPGPGRRDHRCGQLTYDGHDAVDIRLRDYLEMARGYPVLAAAAGRVKAIRDGMPDISVREGGLEAIRGRAAGNGVVLDHGDGWTTQYSHLRRGSVAVSPGQAVAAGAVLGLVGLSGDTEFPHLEFKVRHDGVPIDPFLAAPPGQACSPAPAGSAASLWTPAVAAELVYIPTGLLGAGFAAAAPDSEAIRQGEGRLGPGAEDPAALVFWVDLFGVMAGDEQTFRITGPDGRTFAQDQMPVPAAKVLWFAFSGKRRPAEGWSPGAYKATYSLERHGEVVVSITHEIVIGP